MTGPAPPPTAQGAGGRVRAERSVLAPRCGASPFPGPRWHGPDLLPTSRPSDPTVPLRQSVPELPAWPREGLASTNPPSSSTATLAAPGQGSCRGRDGRTTHGPAAAKVAQSRSQHDSARRGARATRTAAKGVPSPRGQRWAGLEVRSRLTSSRASGHGPASQPVLRCRPGAGGPAAPRARRGRATVPECGTPGGSPRGRSDLPPGGRSRGPSAPSEFSRAVGSAGGRAHSAARHPSSTRGSEGRPLALLTPGQAGAREGSIALWSGRPRRGGVEPAPAPRPLCPGSAPGARP